MKEKILVLAPYDDILLKSLSDATVIGEINYVLVGNKKKILEKCFKNKINIRTFFIYDEEGEINISLLAKDIIEKEDIKFIIFGEISISYQKKILGCLPNDNLNIINVIDFPKLKHFLFISDATFNFNTDFEDKRKAIMNGYNFINRLNINQVNVSLISNNSQKTDSIEANIIKMIIRDGNYKNIDIIGFINISSLFDKSNNNSIYKNNINLLITKNYEITKMFVDTLKVFVTSKVATFNIYKNIISVDSNSNLCYENLIFSLFILDKLKTKIKEDKASLILN